MNTHGEIKRKLGKAASVKRESKAFKCSCGKKTFQKDKICVICKMDTDKIPPR